MGSMFWERLKATSLKQNPDRMLGGPEIIGKHWLWDDLGCPLKRLFSENNDYSLASFHRAMSLYEYVDSTFYDTCEESAAAASLHPESMDLIHAREDLDVSVNIIGGGRFIDRYVVTPKIKAAVVSHLQEKGVSVWAFGDSPMDLPMLKRADQAIVVVGEERSRSKTMDGFSPESFFTPPHSRAFTDCRHLWLSLRGIFPIPLRQPPGSGYNTDGHRLVDESRTAIVALMRGGEPMALGISEVFPSAIFIHAKHATELTKETLMGVQTLLLVDSVVNSGESIKDSSTMFGD
ncbi:uracil phosphoribosyltransferase [Colletotrichum acutatum]